MSKWVSARPPHTSLQPQNPLILRVMIKRQHLDIPSPASLKHSFVVRQLVRSPVDTCTSFSRLLLVLTIASTSAHLSSTFQPRVVILQLSLRVIEDKLEIVKVHSHRELFFALVSAYLRIGFPGGWFIASVDSSSSVFSIVKTNCENRVAACDVGGCFGTKILPVSGAMGI